MDYTSLAAFSKGKRISLESCLITNQGATCIVISEEPVWQVGIMKDAMLLVDQITMPVDGSIVVWVDGGSMKLRRLKLYPRKVLEDLNNPGRIEPMTKKCRLLGVVTYIINDARSGEFDDNPVM